MFDPESGCPYRESRQVYIASYGQFLNYYTGNQGGPAGAGCLTYPSGALYIEDPHEWCNGYARHLFSSLTWVG